MSIKQFIVIYNKPRQPVQQNSFTVTSKPLLACHYCKAFLHNYYISMANHNAIMGFWVTYTNHFTATIELLSNKCPVMLQ